MTREITVKLRRMLKNEKIGKNYCCELGNGCHKPHTCVCSLTLVFVCVFIFFFNFLTVISYSLKNPMNFVK